MAKLQKKSATASAHIIYELIRETYQTPISFPAFILHAPKFRPGDSGDIEVQEIKVVAIDTQVVDRYTRPASHKSEQIGPFRTADDLDRAGFTFLRTDRRHGWGLAHEPWQGIRSIGVDEIAWRKGHKYLTMVYQIDADQKRLLWVTDDREEASLAEFFDLLGSKRSAKLKFVCSDMWQPYLTVIANSAKKAVHVLDRYHVMAKMNKAIDEVRAAEARQLKADGYEPILKHSRWCLLKRPENRTEAQTVKMQELLTYNLKSVRAHLHREDFQRFWEYKSAGWAGKFLDEWCIRVMRSKLEPMKKVAMSLRNHRELLLNWFKANKAISAGTVEGLNNKAKLTIRKAYGFRSSETAKTALFHTLSKLSEPTFTHKFW